MPGQVNEFAVKRGPSLVLIIYFYDIANVIYAIFPQLGVLIIFREEIFSKIGASHPLW